MSFSLFSLFNLTLTTIITYAVAFLVTYSLVSLLVWAFKPLFTCSAFPHIPGPPSQSWITGNLGQLFNSKGLPFHHNLPDRYGGMVKVYGFFGDEQLYISDPRALQNILVKDQDAYEETAVFIETNKAIFGPGLVATVGEQHKRQRRIVKPAFSVTQLKSLTPLLYEIAEKLSDVIAKEARKATGGDGSRLDMSEWMSRVALETVGQAVLGYSFDPLDSYRSNPYTSAVKELIPTLFSLSLVRQFAPFLSRIGSPAFRRKLVELTPHQAVQKVKNMSDVMYETAKGILKEKRRKLSEPDHYQSRRRDIISELLRANDNLGDDQKMSDLEFIGQMTVLIFGAQDTTSSALSRVLYMLSTHPDVQQKVREEIASALNGVPNQYNGRLDYDAITTLPWLDAVLKETLRLFPPVPFVRRTAVKERTVPFTNAKGDLSSVTIPVGTTLFVGIAGANRMESVWGEEAKEWIPERWLASETLYSSDTKLPGIYAGTLSFLGGARSCVGYKLADVEMKIILAVLLSRFSFSTTGETIVWSLSQIISPSVRTTSSDSEGKPIVEEKKGLPLLVQEQAY